MREDDGAALERGLAALFEPIEATPPRAGLSDPSASGGPKGGLDLVSGGQSSEQVPADA
jgi:hypothetical protein